MTASSKSPKARTPARKTAARKTAPSKSAAMPAAKRAQAAPARKSAPVKSAKPVKTSIAAKAVKPEKPKKPKLVRDSFTIPKAEYTVLESLKQRASRAGTLAKKSEVLRAGIKALSGMDDAAFLDAMAAVPAIKTGRPANA